ncbi:hypothetical protein JIN86_19845 [Lysinibacillus sp. HST-98]|uniref:hypothetical protein n=1 Tax=unclassified Lysinibacillus TaxID=2636778 RepID=UPI001926F286|nr:hypothetical protein [Lysinibacillus sp. HST-98]MBL3731827.1 hypothetical protein [Lysinibacillus sp. HST-98]
MHTHGEVQNETVRECIVMNSDYDKSAKVIEFSRIENYVVKKFTALNVKNGKKQIADIL